MSDLRAKVARDLEMEDAAFHTRDDVFRTPPGVSEA